VQALGAFAIGSTPVLAALAGIGAIGAAWRKMAQEAQEASEQAQKAHEESVAVLSRGRPNVAIMEELIKTQEEIARLQRQVAERSAAIQARVSLRLEAGPSRRMGLVAVSPVDEVQREIEADQTLFSLQQQLHAAEQKRVALKKQLAEAHEEIIKRAKQEVDENEVLNRGFMLTLRLAIELRQVMEQIPEFRVPDLRALALPEALRHELDAFQRQRVIRELALPRFGAESLRLAPARQPLASLGPQPEAIPRFGGRGLSLDAEQIGRATANFQALERALAAAGVGAGNLALVVGQTFGAVVAEVVSGTERMEAVVVSGILEMLQQILAAMRMAQIQAAQLAAQQALSQGASASAAAAAGAARGGMLAGPGGAALLAGVAVLGGLLTGLFRRRPEVQPVRDDAARAELARLRQELAQAQRRDRLIALTIVDPRGRTLEEIRYGLLRAERRDAVPRIPSP